MTLDVSVFYLLNGLAGQSPLLDGTIIFFASYLAFIVGILFFVLVYVSDYPVREKWEMFWVTTVATLVARFGVATLIRFFYHHPRPYEFLPNVHNLFTDSSWSFPSGHATFFFAMATALYCYNKRWGAWYFIAAVLITAGRVAAGVHYPSDILGGAVIGIVVAYATFYLARTLRPAEPH